MAEFQVRKDDITQTRVVETTIPEITDGEIVVAIDNFALTANNITYGVVGEKIGYWNFFPPAGEDTAGWGVIPVWGFADVIASKAEDIAEGERLYGYFPMGGHLKMTPTKVKDGRLIDGAAHRSALPPVYNTYLRVNAEPGYDRAMDAARACLYPLYATSFCIYDFLLDHDWYGAERVITVSASSKTAVGLAYALADAPDAPSHLGLTSPGNAEFVRGLGLYDAVTTYDEIDGIDASVPSVIIDMSGSGGVLGQLHALLKDNMRYCSNVGVTHWEDNEMGADFIRERSEMFFAPGHIQKRSQDWGKGVFEQKSFAFWQDAAGKSRDWLSVQEAKGIEGLQQYYDEVREGRLAPKQALIIKP